MVKKRSDFQGCCWIQILTYDTAWHKEGLMRSQERKKLVALNDSLACTFAIPLLVLPMASQTPPRQLSPSHLPDSLLAPCSGHAHVLRLHSPSARLLQSLAPSDPSVWNSRSVAIHRAGLLHFYSVLFLSAISQRSL